MAKGDNVTRTEVSPETEAAQKFLLNIGEQLQNNPQLAEAFGGDFFADFNELQRKSLGGQLLDAGELESQGFGRDTLELGRKQLRGDFLDPASNPFLRDTVDAAIRPVIENFNEQLLPSLRSGIEGAGAFDSTRRQLLESDLGARVSNQIGDISTNLFGENFARERGIQQTSPGLLSAGASQFLLPNLLRSGVGQAFQQDEQLGLQNELAQFREQREAITRPGQAALPFLRSAAGAPAAQTQISPGTSPFAGGLQGGLGALGALAAIPGIGLPLAGLGGLLGGVAGALG